ncbi:MAG: long-chain fatty acid--CoA ligase [Desulfobacterales bacterium]|nr:MAG: long-chain fatty acid--CoA ligase [Desulfobacterales bacterium]
MEVAGIGSWLTKREFLTPEKEAVVDGVRRLNYRELNRRVNRLAGALQGMGLKSGDRISILAYNCLEFLETIMAAAKLGLILVPLNWRHTAAELSFILNDSGAETLLFDSELQELVRGVMGNTSLTQYVVFGEQEILEAKAYESLLAGQTQSEPLLEVMPTLDTPHIIMYTAGTTGKPKGAILSQGASFWNVLNLNLAMDFTSNDRNLVVLPMFHIGGIGLFTLPMLYNGGTAILQRTFDPVKTLTLLREEKISLFFGVPAIFMALIQHPDFDADVFKNVRVVMSGGAPLPVNLVKQYHEAGIILQQGFGMSEAAPSIATLGKDLALKKTGSIGRAVFHLDARVVDDDMNDVPRGDVGELIIQGPNLLQSYWNRPEATQEAFSGDWFHTGDLARMDENGDLYIVERKKDMFISGGENVYPAEVENAIYELPQIAEAAVIGVDDEKWGEVGRAVVVLKKGQRLTTEAIIDHLKGRLAKYKLPKSVVFSDQLPRNAAGKVLKTVLRQEYG